MTVPLTTALTLTLTIMIGSILIGTGALTFGFAGKRRPIQLFVGIIMFLVGGMLWILPIEKLLHQDVGTPAATDQPAPFPKGGAP